jgi:hypothetical protein
MSAKDHISVVDIRELFTLVVFLVTGTLLLAILCWGSGLIIEVPEHVILPEGVLDGALVIRARLL